MPAYLEERKYLPKLQMCPQHPVWRKNDNNSWSEVIDFNWTYPTPIFNYYFFSENVLAHVSMNHCSKLHWCFNLLSLVLNLYLVRMVPPFELRSSTTAVCLEKLVSKTSHDPSLWLDYNNYYYRLEVWYEHYFTWPVITAPVYLCGIIPHRPNSPPW